MDDWHYYYTLSDSWSLVAWYKKRSGIEYPFGRSEWPFWCIEVRNDLFVVVYHLTEEREMAKDKSTKATKETAVDTVKVPNPNQPHADWLAEMAVLNDPINLRDFRDAGGKDKRVWLFEGSRRLSEALHSKVLDVKLKKLGDANINHYSMTPEGKEFWKNGKDEAHSNEQILAGWNALVSMMDDTKSKDE